MLSNNKLNQIVYMHTSLKNKITLLTGVSSGIGRGIAQLLAERGARVFGTVRNVRSASSIYGDELVRMDEWEGDECSGGGRRFVEIDSESPFVVMMIGDAVSE